MLASVIVYTYDRKEFIQRAVDSVMNQTLERDQYEIIVVKGFSDPDIDADLEKKADRVLTVVEKSHGKKLAAGLRSAGGDIIFILDDDDEFEPGKLEKCTAYFNENANLNFLHNSTSTIDEDGNAMPERNEPVPDHVMKADLSALSGRELSSFIRYRVNWYSSCMGFRKDVFRDTTGELEKVDQSVDPFLFFIAISSGGTMMKIPDRLSRYRIHASTTNYILPFSEFVNRRKIFYENSTRIFRQAKDFFGHRSSGRFISALFFHMKLLSGMTDRKVKRGELFNDIIDSLRSLKYVRTRYQIVWLIFSALRFISFSLSMRSLYSYYVRSLTGPVRK